MESEESLDPFRNANVQTYSHRPNVFPVYVLDTVSKGNNDSVDPYGADINGSWFQFKKSIFNPTTHRTEIDQRYLEEYDLGGAWGGDARLKEEFTDYQQLKEANKHRSFLNLFMRTKDPGENDTKVRSTAGYWMGENRSQLKPAFRKFFMQNPLLPLTLRILTLIFCAIALALACSIFVFSRNTYDGAKVGQKASTIMAIVVQTCALVYVIYIAYDEYSGKPLGLRDPIGKFRLVMLDLLFIIFSSANLSLAFDSLYDDEWVCEIYKNPHGVELANQFPVISSICTRQKGLASFLFVVLVTWVLTFTISVVRVIDRVNV
ncbi:hypothetical protein I9W82_004440 [Candida metapsilosis]|uniref:Regulator of phospholipase D SRF1 n=1 Tax=Candida metapsilosis TaxID=273372 RepID=A0A8H7ZFX3_9ASCO|nr:hypothetical protein I9W82_004440 [Candida metapsilosis]